jgi:hypothetical protein
MWSPTWNFNPVPLEYEAAVLITYTAFGWVMRLWWKNYDSGSQPLWDRGPVHSFL